MSKELIAQMLDNIQADNTAEAQENFVDLLSARLSDALDQRKEDIAKQLGAFNGGVQTNS